MNFGLLGLLTQDPIAFFLVAAVLIISITVHEFAHAWMADHLGDPTPRHQDRVTLNPLAHLDPVGTALIFFIGFGWGRPVPFDPYNLKNPVRDAALIAVAGPLSNIIMAIGFTLLLTGASAIGLFSSAFTTSVSLLVVYYNVMLAIFNLIPVHPLDGGKVILALLPKNLAYEYDQFMHRYGMIVLILLILPLTGASPVSLLIRPAINFVSGLILTLT